MNIHGKTTMLMKVMFKHERYESVIESTLIFWSLDRYAIHTGKLILVLTLDTFILYERERYTHAFFSCHSDSTLQSPMRANKLSRAHIVGL